MTRTRLGLAASIGLITLLFAAPRASAQTSPSLGNAGTYSILAGSQITNVGVTTISGDVGVSPGIGPPPHIIGFGTVVLGGSQHDADLSAANAQADKNIAYGALDQACTVTFPGAFKELAGVNLVPGVYCATSFHLTGGTLTLTGSAGDTWIFKSGSDLIISGGAAARVVSPSCNVWWRVVSTATFDAGSSLTGNILADTSITLAAGATLSGRALARTAEVSLSSNAISSCVAPVAPPTPTPTPTGISVTKAFSPGTISLGGISRLTITLNNPLGAAVGLTAAFTDVLPAGVLVAAIPNATTSCGGGLVAAPFGGSTVTLTAGSTIPSGSCTIAVDVTAALVGSFLNTIPGGALQTTGGSNSTPTSATLTTSPFVPPPRPNVCATTQPDLFLVMRHTDPFLTGVNATYTINVFNNGVTPTAPILVADTLPTGLTFVSGTGPTWTCSAVRQIVSCVTSAQNPGSITLTVIADANAVPSVTNAAIVSGGGDCDVTNNAVFDVTAVTPGPTPTPPPPPVPTLSEWAFIALAGLLTAAGIVALRRGKA